MKKIETKITFNVGGELRFENEQACKIYEEMFKDYQACLRSHSSDGIENIEDWFTGPSPLELARRDGFSWELRKRETPRWICEIKNGETAVFTEKSK